MAKQKQNQDDLAELVFPAGGVELTHPSLMGRPDSTPLAENVRYFEPLTGRGRGGSRPGIDRFIDEQASGSNPIQHIAAIVTVDGEMIDFSFDGPNQMFPGVYAGIGFIDFDFVPIPFPDFGIVDGIPFAGGSGYPPEASRKKKNQKIKVSLTGGEIEVDINTSNALQAMMVASDDGPLDAETLAGKHVILHTDSPGNVGDDVDGGTIGHFLVSADEAKKVYYWVTVVSGLGNVVAKSNREWIRFKDPGASPGPDPEIVQYANTHIFTSDPNSFDFGNSTTPFQFDPFTIGHLLVAVLVIKDSVTLALSALSDTNSNTWTFASASPAEANGARIYVWYCINNATDDIDFTVNLGAGHGDAALAVLEIKNIIDSSPIFAAIAGDGGEVIGNVTASPYTFSTYPLTKRGGGQHDLYLGIFGGIYTTAAGVPGSLAGSRFTLRNIDDSVDTVIPTANLVVEDAVNPSLDDGVHKITITAGGGGYTSPPTISFTGGGGSGAAATAVLTAGVVTSITINAPGSAYSSTPTVVFTGDGTGAAAVVNATVTPEVTHQFHGFNYVSIAICFKQA